MKKNNDKGNLFKMGHPLTTIEIPDTMPDLRSLHSFDRTGKGVLLSLPEGQNLDLKSQLSFDTEVTRIYKQRQRSEANAVSWQTFVLLVCIQYLL